MSYPIKSDSASRDPSSSGPPTTATVLDFICLFTHDLRRKQKRWQDGKLKFHTFNKRFMVYDDRGNFIGDGHWQGDYGGGGDFEEGLELELDRGAAIVQVAECVGSREQDLTEILDKRAREVEKRRASAALKTPVRIAAGLRQDGGSSSSGVIRPHPQAMHRPLNALVPNMGPIGRAAISDRSPYEARKGVQPTASTHYEQTPKAPPAKRRRVEVSPPSKMGHAQSLFGTRLTLVASSAPYSSFQGKAALRDRTNEPPVHVPLGIEKKQAEGKRTIQEEDEEGSDVVMVESSPGLVEIRKPVAPTSKAVPRRQAPLHEPNKRLVPDTHKASEKAKLLERQRATGQRHTSPPGAQSPQRIEESENSEDEVLVASTPPEPTTKLTKTTAKPATISRPRMKEPPASTTKGPELDHVNSGMAIKTGKEEAKPSTVHPKKIFTENATERRPSEERSIAPVTLKPGDKPTKKPTKTKNSKTNTNRREKPAPDNTVEPEMGKSGVLPPSNLELRTELRIKPRKRRGLLMLSEAIDTPPPPPSKAVSLKENESIGQGASNPVDITMSAEKDEMAKEAPKVLRELRPPQDVEDAPMQSSNDSDVPMQSGQHSNRPVLAKGAGENEPSRMVQPAGQTESASVLSRDILAESDGESDVPVRNRRRKEQQTVQEGVNEVDAAENDSSMRRAASRRNDAAAVPNSPSSDPVRQRRLQKKRISKDMDEEEEEAVYPTEKVPSMSGLSDEDSSRPTKRNRRTRRRASPKQVVSEEEPRQPPRATRTASHASGGFLNGDESESSSSDEIESRVASGQRMPRGPPEAVESGPRIAKMSRKSVKCKEIFGFVVTDNLTPAPFASAMRRIGAPRDVSDKPAFKAVTRQVSDPVGVEKAAAESNPPSFSRSMSAVAETQREECNAATRDATKLSLGSDQDVQAVTAVEETSMTGQIRIKSLESEVKALASMVEELQAKAAKVVSPPAQPQVPADKQSSETANHESGSGSKPRIMNPATRGKKAARREHAAGQVPQCVVPFEPVVPRERPRPVVAERSPANAPPSKPVPDNAISTRTTLSGFSKANGGAWSKHAEDLLGMTRPAGKAVGR